MSPSISIVGARRIPSTSLVEASFLSKERMRSCQPSQFVCAFAKATHVALRRDQRCGAVRREHRHRPSCGSRTFLLKRANDYCKREKDRALGRRTLGNETIFAARARKSFVRVNKRILDDDRQLVAAAQTPRLGPKLCRKRDALCRNQQWCTRITHKTR
jgi:hypothetical protein